MKTNTEAKINVVLTGNSYVETVSTVIREYFVSAVTGFLIANLAVADLGVGMLCIPFTVVYFELNFNWPFGAVMCKLLPALMSCFVMGSVGTMLAISIGKPTIHNILYTTTRNDIHAG